MARRLGARSEGICGAASLLLPLALYLWTAAPAPTWLDSGEFIATGFVFGAAHPPGHPLFITLVRLACLVPLGPIALRAAAVSALFGALSCFILFKVALALTRRLDSEAPPWIGSLFAMLGALALAVAPALWGQSVRPEVYTTQLALVLGALLALSRFALGERGLRDGRLLAAAALAFGLSLSNHHFLSFLLLPGVIVLVTEDALASWRRTLRLVFAGALPALVFGLLPYAHLMLRAHAPGAVSLGVANSPSSLAWVVSARAFQRAMVDPPTTPFGDRAGEAVLLLLGQLGPAVAVVAVGGLYFLCRQRIGLGLLVLLWAVATWLARSWLGFDPQNSDVLGYFLVAAAVIALGAARVGPLIASIVPARQTVRVGAATVAAAGLVTSTVFVGLDARETCDLSRQRGAEVIAAEQLGRLPPRAVLVTELFQSCFNVWAVQVTDMPRPDVAHFHLPFIGYPGYAHQVHERHRDLRGVLRAALSTGELVDTEVSALAQRRPVFVEPTMTVPEALEPFLLPSGLVWEASAEPLGRTDLELATPPHTARWDEVIARVGADGSDEQTRRVLLWRLYLDALLLARRGQREGADAAAERALAYAPGSLELTGLREALAEGDGPLDVTPFLPESARRAMAEDEPDEADSPNVLDF